MTRSLTIRPNVHDGDLHPNAWRTLREEVAKYRDGTVVEITIKKAKKKRSLNQNAFMHGPFLQSMAAMFLEYGNEYDDAMVKAIFKKQFGEKVAVTLPDGTQDMVELSTAEYTTEQCENAMERARRRYAEFWQLPYPNEVIDE